MTLIGQKNWFGISNELELDFARYLSSINKPIWIRQVLIPGITDKEEDLLKLKEFLSSLNNVEKIELLPYHDLGKFKWEELRRNVPIRAAYVQQLKKMSIELKRYLEFKVHKSPDYITSGLLVCFYLLLVFSLTIYLGLSFTSMYVFPIYSPIIPKQISCIPPMKQIIAVRLAQPATVFPCNLHNYCPHSTYKTKY